MNDGSKRFVKIREASLLTGIECQTLRKMADNGTIASFKTPSGQRRISKEAIEKFCSNGVCNNESKKETMVKKNYIYARVSSKKQVDDLNKQIEFLKREQYASYDIISDVCSGLNFRRKGLTKILEACLQGSIGEIVIAYKDRLARFGYELIEQMVNMSGGKITVLEDKEKTYEEEFTEDLLSIVHIFSCRQMGRRKYKKTENTIEVSED